MEKLRKDKGTICLFILPALFCYLMIATFPLLCSAVLSFADWDVAGLNGFIGFKNYIQLFTTDKIFQDAVIHTLIATVLCLLIQVPCSILLAYLLTKIRRGRNFLKWLFCSEYDLYSGNRHSVDFYTAS
ncbi:hypothetical protein LC724_20740 [Blautia sp. RD014234]|nr:hypothetical protein [Blautia parvula]